MRSPLEEKRKKIDAIDVRLAALLVKRLAIAASLAELKQKVRDTDREAGVLRRAVNLTKDRKLRAAMLAVYREILKQGRRLQSDIPEKRKFSGK